MWGRLATCGGLVTRLGGICTLVGRPSTTRPQDAILPHINYFQRRWITRIKTVAVSTATANRMDA
jgi:hypothetical protein